MKEKLFNAGMSIGVSLLPYVAFAQRYSAPDAPTSVGEFEDVIDIVLTWMFSFLVFLAVVFVIVAAYKYLTAAGDPEKVKSASNTLIYAAIAIAVALLARGLPFLVGGLIGRDIGGGAGGTTGGTTTGGGLF